MEEPRNPAEGTRSSDVPTNDAQLQQICDAVKEIEDPQKHAGDSSFEIRGRQESQRQAPVLRYVSTLLNNEINGKGQEREASPKGKRIRTVVAVALVQAGDEWRFVAAVNGHKSLAGRQQEFIDRIPTDIGGIPVDVVSDESNLRVPPAVRLMQGNLDAMLEDRKKQRGDGTLTKTYSRTFETEHQKVVVDTTVAMHKLTAESVWQWHSEQKLLRYVKMVYGGDARKSIAALGVSQVPCDDMEGSNYCLDYLQRKWLRLMEGTKDSAVPAYWYKRGSGSILSPACTLGELTAHQIDVTTTKTDKGISPRNRRGQGSSNPGSNRGSVRGRGEPGLHQGPRGRGGPGSHYVSSPGRGGSSHHQSESPRGGSSGPSLKQRNADSEAQGRGGSHKRRKPDEK